MYWESCQTKYTDIRTAFIEQYPTPPDDQPRGTTYPTDENTKTQILSKLKALRTKYSDAVDTQRRSGHGRVITLFFYLCNDIWGGSPGTTSLENGIETAEVNGDTVDSCSESSVISDQTEESQPPDPEYPNPTPETKKPTSGIVQPVRPIDCLWFDLRPVEYT